MRLRLFLFLCGSLILTVANSLAQQPYALPQAYPSHIRNLSEQNTTVAQCLMDMIQGKDGRIWFNPCFNQNAILSLHLVEFDGYTFKPVSLGDQPPLSTTGTLLCGQTPQGLLYGFTNNNLKNYVFIIDPLTEEVKYFDFQPFPIEDLQVRNVLLSTNGEFIVLVSGQRSLHLFSIRQDTIGELAQVDFPNPNPSPSKLVISKFPLFETEEALWFMADSLPLYHFEKKSGRITKADQVSFYSNGDIKPHQQKIDITTDSKIFLFDKQLILFFPYHSPSFYTFDPKKNMAKPIKGLPEPYIGRGLFRDSRGQLLFLFDSNNGRRQAILQQPDKAQIDYSRFVEGRPEEHIYNIAGQDFSKHLFVFSDETLMSMGVRQTDHIRSFDFPISRGATGAVNGNNFIFYTESSSPKIIKSGVQVEDLNIVSFPDAPCFVESIINSDRLSRDMIHDENGIYWFNKSDSIIAYDPKSNDCRAYPAGTHVIRVANLNEHAMVFLGLNRSPFLLDKKTGQTQKIKSDIPPPGFVSQIHATPDSIIWITTSGGLWKIDIPEQKSDLLGFDERFSDFRFQAIQEDEMGRLWLGSMTGGVQIYNRQNGTVQVVDQNQGLANNAVMSLVQDQEGVMWAGTKNGLSIISPEGAVLATLTTEDGLPGNRFRRFGAQSAADGSLFFTLDEGVVHIKSDSLKNQLLQAESSHQIYLTSLSFLDKEEGKDLTLSGVPDLDKTIILPAANRYLKLKVALSSFIQPERNHFAYKIEGRDNDWIYLGTQHEIILSRLPAGQYRLLIKGADYRNNWTDTSLAISIQAHKFFYEEWWFYALLLSLAGVLLFIWVQRLRSEKTRLEVEVEKRTQQIRSDKELIEQQAKELRQLDELKTRFFTNISHELRTPITLISVPIEQALKSQGNKISAAIQKNLKLALKNSRKLLGLVEELLDLSRLEANKLKLDEVSTPIVPFTFQLFNAFESRAKLNDIQYTFETQFKKDQYYLIDRKRFEKIIDNLISNALKFTPNGGTVTVRLLKKTDQIHIQIEDNGRGIPPEDLPHIFDRYFQTRRKELSTEGGTGIGLAFAKELARLMKGDLHVRSQWGEGTTFSLQIPARTIEKGSSTESPIIKPVAVAPPIFAESNASKQGLAPKEVNCPRVLIVEDNRDMQRLICDLLSDDYELQLADHGAQAWEMMNNGQLPPEKIDLILSDIMMPQMDGYELLERIKQHPEWKKRPVIMLTALAEQEDKLQALRLGVDDYLVKPFSPTELLARMANLLSNYHKREAFQEEEQTALQIEFNKSESADQLWLKELENLARQALKEKLELSASYLADGLNLSDRQLLRRIKALTGLSTKQYIQEVKLQKARHLLESRSFDTIAEVAYASGFNTPGYFSQVYEKCYGKKPASYFSADSPNHEKSSK